MDPYVGCNGGKKEGDGFLMDKARRRRLRKREIRF
jgi:hypothetical protein